MRPAGFVLLLASGGYPTPAYLKLRVAARIADANTSDDAAFDVAKDGQKAIDALSGAASAERRRILKSKRKRGGSAFAFAGSF